MSVHGFRSSPIAAALCGVMLGCGGGGESAVPGTTGADGTDNRPGPPIAAIEPQRTAAGDSASAPRPAGADPRSDIEMPTGGPAKGTPEWYLQEIAVLRTSPLPNPRSLKDPKQPEAGTIGPRGVEQALEKRNLEVVDLALQVIVKTHEDASKVELFNEGVRRLLEARLQLALTGNEQFGRDLYTDAQSFHERDPRSAAAAIAAHALLRYAQTNAYRHGREDKEWIEEYARQAKLFATNFPADEELCTAALAGAARSCELNGLPRESVNCHSLLVQRFPKSPQSRLSTGVLRRLKLVGQPLKLAGPTIDGGFTSMDDHRDRVVLVTFWSSAAKPFREQLPKVQTLSSKYAKYGLTVIGVCLDEDESSANAFLGEYEITWPQLFHSEVEKRAWEHPAAEYYGVRDVPTYILVDHTGVVRLVASDADGLEDGVRTHLLRLRDKLRAGRD